MSRAIERHAGGRVLAGVEPMEGRRMYAVSPAPGAPDLVYTHDTGISSTDNITNLDNSTPEKALKFTVAGTVAGATVGVYSSGTLIGTATATGATTTVTTFGTFDLPDGVRSLTARQTTPGNTQSVDSSALALTIDTVGPTYSGSPVFNYLTAKPTITINYSEPIVSLSTGSMNVMRNTATAGLIRSKATATASGVTISFPFSPNGIIPDGDYTLSAYPGTAVDVAGNVSTGNTTLNFFYLAGDLNRDRKVDFNDFLVLQNNYNTTGKDFSQGDFDYDGDVDFNDFLILQNNYGKSV